MSRQFAFPVFAAVAALLSVTAIPTSSSYAEACLAAPNAPAPQGSHWFYRIERPSLRKCWRLVKRDEQPQRTAKRAAPQPEPVEEMDAAPAAQISERVAQSAPQHGWLTRSASAVPEAVAPLQAPDPLDRTSERADEQASAPPPPAPVVQEQRNEAAPASVAPPQAAQPKQTTVAQTPAAAAPASTGMLQFVFVVIAAIGLLAAAIFFFIDMRRRRTDVLTRISRDDEASFEAPDEDAPTFSAMPPITLTPQHDDVDEALRRSRRRRMAA